MKILTCNSNRPLAEAISAYLGQPLTSASVRRFSDMEVFVEIHENVRGEDAFALSKSDLDITDSSAVAAAVREHQPEVLVNCAAYTKVDDAEKNESIANAVNGSAVEILGRAAGVCCAPRRAHRGGAARSRAARLRPSVSDRQSGAGPGA